MTDPDFHGYAAREFDVLNAWMCGQLTRDEYRHLRWWAYELYGYESPHPRPEPAAAPD